MRYHFSSVQETLLKWIGATKKNFVENEKAIFKFYQVNKDNSEYLRSCLKENPKALELLFLFSTTWTNTMLLYAHTKVFQEALGIGQATVARSVKYLKDNGFLYIYKKWYK